MGSWCDVYIAFPIDVHEEFANVIYKHVMASMKSEETFKAAKRVFNLGRKIPDKHEIERCGVKYIVLSWHDIKWFEEIPEVKFIEDFVDKHSLPYMRIIDDEFEVEKNNTLFTTYMKICVDY